ncbi:MAG TPA: hypothetical protein PLA71_00495 [Saccharofermentans sp.]|nr:hypothetical protein [Saccharofermentans sp.]
MANIDALPNYAQENIIVYENEFITFETVNRCLVRLLNNDKSLYNSLAVKVEELLEVSKGYGTTKSFKPESNLTVETDEVLRLTTDDFGKFVLMVGTDNGGTHGPIVILPADEDLTDDDIGQSYTFTAVNAGALSASTKVCRIYSERDTTGDIINFLGSMNYADPDETYPQMVESSTDNCHGSFARIILVKHNDEFKWVFQGDGTFWAPKDSSDAISRWSSDGLDV